MTDTITTWQERDYIVNDDESRHEAMQAEIDELRAALAQQAEQGWVRVPVEPTEEMINAYASVPYDKGSIASECRSGWRAMLAASQKETK
jgi:hypothetical protein